MDSRSLWTYHFSWIALYCNNSTISCRTLINDFVTGSKTKWLLNIELFDLVIGYTFQKDWKIQISTQFHENVVQTNHAYQREFLHLQTIPHFMAGVAHKVYASA